MGRTNRPSTPWARRAQAGQLPVRDYTGRIASTSDTLATLGRERITINARSYTIADLQAAIAREENER